MQDQGLVITKGIKGITDFRTKMALILTSLITGMVMVHSIIQGHITMAIDREGATTVMATPILEIETLGMVIQILRLMLWSNVRFVLAGVTLLQTVQI